MIISLQVKNDHRLAFRAIQGILVMIIFEDTYKIQNTCPIKYETPFLHALCRGFHNLVYSVYNTSPQKF